MTRSRRMTPKILLTKIIVNNHSLSWIPVDCLCVESKIKDIKMNWTKNLALTSIATNFDMREYLWKVSPILEAILVSKMLHTLVELALTLTVLFGSIYISFYRSCSIYRGYCRQNIPITPLAIPKYLTGALYKIHCRTVMVRSVVPILEKIMPNTGWLKHGMSFVKSQRYS